MCFDNEKGTRPLTSVITSLCRVEGLSGWYNYVEILKSELLSYPKRTVGLCYNYQIKKIWRNRSYSPCLPGGKINWERDRLFWGRPSAKMHHPSLWCEGKCSFDK